MSTADEIAAKRIEQVQALQPITGDLIDQMAAALKRLPAYLPTEYVEYGPRCPACRGQKTRRRGLRCDRCLGTGCLAYSVQLVRALRNWGPIEG